MGEGACFVAEREGRILGVMGAAVRRLALPGGEERPVVYLGDVKIDPPARGGRALLRLAEAVREWVGTRAKAAFSVVMDGTSSTPTRYTGRLGIPLFSELAKIMVLRLPTSEIQVDPGHDWLTTGERGGVCYLNLSAGRYACPGGNPAERSETEPLEEPEPFWGSDPVRNARLLSHGRASFYDARLPAWFERAPARMREDRRDRGRRIRFQ